MATSEEFTVKKWLMIFVFICGAVPAAAQSFVGPEFKAAEGAKPSMLLNGLFVKTTPIGESAVGFYVYGLINQSPWAQIHGGLSVNPRKWIGFTLGAGTEKSDAPWRIGGSFFVAGRGNVAFLAMEDGGSGLWYRVHYTRRLNSRVNLGVISRRFSPTGPYVEVKVAPRLTAWSTVGPNLETDRTTGIVGLNVAIP